MPASVRVKLNPDAGTDADGARIVRGATVDLVAFGAPPSNADRETDKPAQLVFSAGFLDEVRGAPAPEHTEFARVGGTLRLQAQTDQAVFVFDPDAAVEYDEEEVPEEAPYRRLALRYGSDSFRAAPTGEALRLRIPAAPEGARFFELGAALLVDDADETTIELNDRLDVPLRPIGVVSIESTFWVERMPYLDDARMFRVGLKAIYGDAMPTAAIEALRRDLVEGRFVHPTWVANQDLDPDINGFFHEGTIHLDEPLVIAAKDDPEKRWSLFLTMIEEIGHCLDDALRNRYSNIGGDAEGDEGSMFAADFVHFNKLVESDIEFGTFEIDDGFARSSHRYALDPAVPDREAKAKELLFMEDELADQGDVTLPSGEVVRVEFFKIRGGGAVHETITKWAAILAGVDYGTALDEGCAWPDVPCTDQNSVETCYYKTWRNLHKEGTLANRSHYGDLQYWHSMAPGDGFTNGEVVDLIVTQLRTWFQAAIDDDELFHIGKMLHTVQDSYSRSHVIRETSTSDVLSTKKVIRFQAYDKQDSHKHGEADKIKKGGVWKIPGALDARRASKTVLAMFKRKATLDELETFLRESVYPFAAGAKDAAAGGSHEDFTPDWD